MEILDNYIQQLIEHSTPQHPIWNIEKIRSGKPNTWNYIDGCMIKALITLYDITSDKRYLEFSDNFIDYFVKEDGSIKYYDVEEYNLDNVNAGKTLFNLYELTKKEKYKKAIELIHKQLLHQPRTKEGNFWHKKIYPDQVWLDGLYMAQPFYMEYSLAHHDDEAILDSLNQFKNVQALLRCEKNGLYYHAYDSSRKMFWCDKVTGLSNNFWLRAEGWFAMAILDTWEIMPDSMATEKAFLQAMFCDLIDSMLPYQDEDSGMWYQVINYGGIRPNYLETSGSAIFAFAIMKGVRLGILNEKYFAYGKKAFDGICNNYLTEDTGMLQLDNICLVAGLGNTDMREGTFNYYMREPIVKNDAKGIAPLILAYTEILQHNHIGG